MTDAWYPISSAPKMIEVDRCARMVLAASQQATEDAIRWLEMAQKYGEPVLAEALKQLREKARALSSTPIPLPKPPEPPHE